MDSVTISDKTGLIPLKRQDGQIIWHLMKTPARTVCGQYENARLYDAMQEYVENEPTPESSCGVCAKVSTHSHGISAQHPARV